MQQEIMLGELSVRYVVRQSSRARHINLKVSPSKGLEVIVPRKVSVKKIEAILRKKSDWILGHYDQIEAAHAVRQLPDEIDLQALGDVLQVEYDASKRWGRRKWALESDDLLVISVDRQDVDGCAKALRDWLRHQAEEALLAWLSDVSLETELDFAEGSIRNQKTRWGSCSRAKNISLNQKLLFLPPEWVHYILVHELCHTQQMNHSKSFWQQVRHYLPEAMILDRTMRKNAMAMVPWWCE